jgi:hypothetical protein
MRAIGAAIGPVPEAGAVAGVSASLALEKMRAGVPTRKQRSWKVARAKEMTEIAQKTGLSREQLYRSFSERGNPTLKTTLAAMRALGIDMTTKPHVTA